jgi:hypothetical protein
VPFTTEPVEILARHRAVLETSLGEITIAFTPDKAPEHVRNFRAWPSSASTTT